MTDAAETDVADGGDSVCAAQSLVPGPYKNSDFMPPLLVVIGATGTGKSALAVNLALQMRQQGFEAEIINADAMQQYRGMNIGTAKLTAAEMQGIPHHLFDTLEPSAEASVSAHQQQATLLINSMRESGKASILVGGSGLYINSAIYKMQLAPHDVNVRQSLEQKLEDFGLESLVAQLRAADPAGCEQLDLCNPRRVVRALEVLQITGESITANLPQQPELMVPTFIVGVREEREVLVQRLDARVEQMWRDGLLDEVRQLLLQGLEKSKTASQAIGYAQAVQQLRGELSEVEAIAMTQQLTRRYARRQVSWFGRLHDVFWISSEQSQDAAVWHEILQKWREAA
ncbi:MAG: tRNA (adenosine(37)-N6)-dimethylallyltransferase MiaA [Microbacteriaceae bacterium]|nr:tRNA (adenosine(37)-N6)-dimethylallyltransferase MiaA [Microbacteriaceae bacterium]